MFLQASVLSPGWLGAFWLSVQSEKREMRLGAIKDKQNRGSSSTNIDLMKD